MYVRCSGNIGISAFRDLLPPDILPHVGASFYIHKSLQFHEAACVIGGGLLPQWNLAQLAFLFAKKVKGLEQEASFFLITKLTTIPLQPIHVSLFFFFFSLSGNALFLSGRILLSSWWSGIYPSNINQRSHISWCICYGWINLIIKFLSSRPWFIESELSQALSPNLLMLQF